MACVLPSLPPSLPPLPSCLPRCTSSSVESLFCTLTLSKHEKELAVIAAAPSSLNTNAFTSTLSLPIAFPGNKRSRRPLFFFVFFILRWSWILPLYWDFSSVFTLCFHYLSRWVLLVKQGAGFYKGADSVLTRTRKQCGDRAYDLFTGSSVVLHWTFCQCALKKVFAESDTSAAGPLTPINQRLLFSFQSQLSWFCSSFTLTLFSAHLCLLQKAFLCFCWQSPSTALSAF